MPDKPTTHWLETNKPSLHQTQCDSKFPTLGWLDCSCSLSVGGLVGSEAVAVAAVKQGPAGARGPTGPAGEQGPAGVVGATGPRCIASIAEGLGRTAPVGDLLAHPAAGWAALGDKPHRGDRWIRLTGRPLSGVAGCGWTDAKRRVIWWTTPDALARQIAG